MIAKSIVVSGHVQGVSFRYFVCELATSLGVVGHVANRSDGSVHIVAKGDGLALQNLISACKVGPEHARVDDVVVKAIPLFVADSFDIV